MTFYLYSFVLMILLGVGHTAEKSDHEDVFIHHFDDNTTIKIYRKPFIESEHSITECDVGYICLIDDKPIFGTDGVAPRYVVDRIILRHHALDLQLDSSSMFNPWFRSNPTVRLKPYSKDGILIEAFLSDGAGSYIAQWLIVGESSVRTLLTDDLDIIYLLLDQ